MPFNLTLWLFFRLIFIYERKIVTEISVFFSVTILLGQICRFFSSARMQKCTLIFMSWPNRTEPSSQRCILYGNRIFLTYSTVRIRKKKENKVSNRTNKIICVLNLMFTGWMIWSHYILEFYKEKLSNTDYTSKIKFKQNLHLNSSVAFQMCNKTELKPKIHWTFLSMTNDLDDIKLTIICIAVIANMSNYGKMARNQWK